ncbi:hypothetical protein C0995_011470 [Termitomyces sp. Mi166|nr:hypothetical protein C0995_011470 [Termitomyces sp. Mi166\
MVRQRQSYSYLVPESLNSSHSGIPTLTIECTTHKQGTVRRPYQLKEADMSGGVDMPDSNQLNLDTTAIPCPKEILNAGIARDLDETVEIFNVRITQELDSVLLIRELCKMRINLPTNKEWSITQELEEGLILRDVKLRNEIAKYERDLAHVPNRDPQDDGRSTRRAEDLSPLMPE